MIDRTHGYFDKEKEMMSRKKRESYLKERLSEILRYGYRHSKGIQSRFDAVGIKPERITNLKDLEKLPITKKKDLVTAQNRLFPLEGLRLPPRKE
ncbi:MAG: hypothetical protein ACXU9X_08105 [Thermodesulfobacteriota bacterium]